MYEGFEKFNEAIEDILHAYPDFDVVVSIEHGNERFPLLVFPGDKKTDTEILSQSNKVNKKRPNCRELMSVEEVADFLEISTRTVWDLAERGEIPAPIKIGTKITRWKRTAIEKWLSEKLEHAEKKRKQRLDRRVS